MSPLFVLAGFGECPDDYHISFASAVAMRVLIALKISRVSPASYSCDLVGVQRFVVIPLPSFLRGMFACVPFLRACRVWGA